MTVIRIHEGHFVTFEAEDTKGIFWILVGLSLEEGEVVSLEGHYWTREGSDFIRIPPDDPQAVAFSRNATA